MAGRRISMVEVRFRQLRTLFGPPRRNLQTLGFIRRLSMPELLRGRLVLRMADGTLEVPLSRAWAFPHGRYYESDVIEAFDFFLEQQESPVVYDIGANLGLFTVRAASRAQHVCAFEPVDETRAVLMRNVELGGFRNVTVLAQALSNSPGVGEISRFSSSGNDSIVAPSVESRHVVPIGVQTVETARLDDVVADNQLPLPTLVKIDVEGAELLVLQGARAVIQSSRPTMLIEYVDDLAVQASYSLRDLEEELQRSGYSAEVRDRTIIARPT